LTKEKFSLQRTLAKSQELAETLATDNSALTDKFNQQVCASFPDDISRIFEASHGIMMVFSLMAVAS
jgi:hypothetical protein